MACSGMLKYGRYILRIYSWLVERTLVKFCFLFADIRERFHYLILVTIVTLRNLTEFNWNLGKWKEETFSFSKWNEKECCKRKNGKNLYLRKVDGSSGIIRAIFALPWKMVSVIVRYLFYQPMDEKIKTWPFRFPAKKNLIWRRHWSIGQSCCSWLQYDVKAKYRLISRKFSGMKFFFTWAFS